MWHIHWTEIIYVGQWPIFHGPVILLYILQTTWWTNVIIGLLDPCDAKIYHIKCMWVSDLHFMVQWFCLICWRHFDGGMLDWRYWFSVTSSLTTYTCICRWPTFCTLTCISWWSDFKSFTYLLYPAPPPPHPHPLQNTVLGGIIFSACAKFHNSEILSFHQQIRFCIITSIPFVRFW